MIFDTKKASKIISDIRDNTWESYLSDEVVFYREALLVIFNERLEIKDILDKTISEDVATRVMLINTRVELLEFSRSIFGEFASKIFPYFYELSKSVTQSRRSRAGAAFEEIIKVLMEKFSYQYGGQKSIGIGAFKKRSLSKVVDGIIPNIESYDVNRSKCMVVTMKTTLRERWQEVIEELERSKIPSIYLLTLDNEISANLLIKLKNHNVSLVVYDEVKKLHDKHSNTVSFEHFLSVDVPHVLEWWKK